MTKYKRVPLRLALAQSVQNLHIRLASALNIAADTNTVENKNIRRLDGYLRSLTLVWCIIYGISIPYGLFNAEIGFIYKYLIGINVLLYFS